MSDEWLHYQPVKMLVKIQIQIQSFRIRIRYRYVNILTFKLNFALVAVALTICFRPSNIQRENYAYHFSNLRFLYKSSL